MTLREKAVRLLEWLDLAAAIGGKDTPWAREVFQAYLAEHSADDGEPIDGDWLERCGWSKDDHPVKWTHNRDDALPFGLWHVDDGWKAMLLWHEHGASSIVRGLKTRGQVRRLCEALGIPLSPSP